MRGHQEALPGRTLSPVALPALSEIARVAVPQPGRIGFVEDPSLDCEHQFGYIAPALALGRSMVVVRRSAADTAIAGRSLSGTAAAASECFVAWQSMEGVGLGKDLRERASRASEYSCFVEHIDCTLVGAWPSHAQQ